MKLPFITQLKYCEKWDFEADPVNKLKPSIKNYFASSDPHHDISKQLVDTTFVWSFCHGTFAQLTIPIICFTWQVIVHVSLSNRI